MSLCWLCCVFVESDSHFAPDSDALRDTLREPLPPKQTVMPPKWLMSSTPEPGTPSNHPTTQYSSPSAPSTAASKHVRPVSSAGVSTQQSSFATSQAPKQPPLPPPKPVNRTNTTMLGMFSFKVMECTRSHAIFKCTLETHVSHSECSISRGECSMSMNSKEKSVSFTHILVMMLWTAWAAFPQLITYHAWTSLAATFYTLFQRFTHWR